MYYKIYGPYEIPLQKGKFKKRIDKEDIGEFWRSVDKVDEGLKQACGVYIFSIEKNYKEIAWYVGKAQSQSFSQECFTPHKIVRYHEALELSKGTANDVLLGANEEEKAQHVTPNQDQDRPC